jgi:choline dehydrogenase-like flavoprotein
MRIVVVGSGVSGTHAALTLLERGHNVELWDVGRQEDSFSEPGVSFHDLKHRLTDVVSYFLGPNLEALVPPGCGELLRYPPSRHFLAADKDPLWRFLSDGFAPFGSYSRGGLANGWGANALSFDENDLAGWPVSFSEMDSAYRIAYERIPVAGPAADDLSSQLAGVYRSQPPVRLSGADERLMRAYEKKQDRLRTLGVRLGLARLAVVTDPQRAEACNYCDRCLWGCPRGSIYNPGRTTLQACESFPGFRYVAGRRVLSLVPGDGKITGIRFVDTSTGQAREEPCDVVFLAAGALETGAIFLRSLGLARSDVSPETEGLMDTTVVKLPYVFIGGIGRASDARAFQYNRLIMGVVADSGAWPRYLHGEVLHLPSLLYHPLIESMPFGSSLSKRLFFALKPALGVVSLFFPDRITPGNRAVLADDSEAPEGVRLCYRETSEQRGLIAESVAKVRSALRRLGCIPKGVLQAPPGAGIHYAGTVPMGEGIKRCDASGKSNLFANLYIADGAAFPSLPSKSITMSLAAHAIRVARGAQL